MPMPEVPDPESVPTVRDRVEAKLGEQSSDDALEWLDRSTPLEVRHVQEPHWLEPTRREPTQDLWFRAGGEVPDDPLLHACVVAYASDLTLLDPAVMAHEIKYDDGGFMIASLDHAMWFHRPFRADEWLLYHQKSPSAYGARGLAEGFIYTRDGRLAITVIQEGLMRPVKRDRGSGAGEG
jgi:acyl-CoA thioesterase-2